MARFEACAPDGMENAPIFKQVGMRMVLFGMREPKLYQLLFMEENTTAASFDDLFNRLGPTAQSCIDTICDTYGLTGAQARMLFENVWIYTFGVGALCATRVCSFSQQQLGQMLTTQFQGMMMLIKSGNYPSNGQGIENPGAEWLAKARSERYHAHHARLSGGHGRWGGD